MSADNVSLDYIYSLMEKGLLGRKGQVFYYLSKENNSGFNVSREKWAKLRLSQKIRKLKIYKNKGKLVNRKISLRYSEIRVHKLWSARIGEYIPRYLKAREDSKKNVRNGILDVFVLSDCVNHNSRLSKIIGRNIHIIDDMNVDVWVYVLCHFPKVEFTKYWNDYADRSNDILFKPNNTIKYLKLTEDEEKEGQNKKRLMGLQNPYVCISSRDAQYLNSILQIKNWRYHNYRDSDIYKFNLSAEYLSEKGITVVRMGRYVNSKVSFNNCIDYANKYYDELMDMFLMKGCKFYVGDTNGLLVVPMVYNRPVAFKNMLPVLDNSWNSYPQNPQNLLIYKKYYKKSEDRFLSFEEMAEIDKKVRFDGRKYAKLGIEVVENTAEEILDLTVEMNARIDGEWVETQEDIELQKRYQDIFNKWCKKMNFDDNCIYRGRIGALFLRKNQFLLE